MLYLIGLGLNENGISKEGAEAARKCDKVYLESYTVDFPYTRKDLERSVGKQVIPAEREKVESSEIVEEAKKEDVAMLVYGSPLTATTHISLIDEARKNKVKFKIIYNASILDAVAESGLQIYRFGKITSMPAWKENYNPSSFMDVVKLNLSVDAHTLILADIGLNIKDAVEQMNSAAKSRKVSLDKVIVCQSLGTKNAKILYKNLKGLKKLDSVRKPYCLIIPAELHFTEKEFLESL